MQFLWGRCCLLEYQWPSHYPFKQCGLTTITLQTWAEPVTGGLHLSRVLHSIFYLNLTSLWYSCHKCPFCFSTYSGCLRYIFLLFTFTCLLVGIMRCQEKEVNLEKGNVPSIPWRLFFFLQCFNEFGVWIYFIYFAYIVVLLFQDNLIEL